MTRVLSLAAVAVLLLAGSSCSSGRRSPVGFRLPEDGEIGLRRAAFVELGCQKCHKVAGEEFPAPTVDPPVPVVL